MKGYCKVFFKDIVKKKKKKTLNVKDGAVLLFSY